MRLTLFLFVVPILGLACSLLNRQGPDVTCDDLADGTTNACNDGIIASCNNGMVTYEVCDDSEACSASWQVDGAFSCDLGGNSRSSSSSTSAATSGSGGNPSAVCGFNYAGAECGACVETECCAISQVCADDTDCKDCATRPGNVTPCAPDLFPLYDALMECLSSMCSGKCL